MDEVASYESEPASDNERGHFDAGSAQFFRFLDAQLAVLAECKLEAPRRIVVATSYRSMLANDTARYPMPHISPTMVHYYRVLYLPPSDHDIIPYTRIRSDVYTRLDRGFLPDDRRTPNRGSTLYD